VKSSDRTILIVLPLIALAIGFYLLVLAPKQREAGELQDKADSLSAEIQTSETAISTAEAARSSFAKNYADMVKLGTAVPEDDDQATLIHDLDAMGTDNDLDFQSFAATDFVGISSAAWMMIAIAILAAILLSRTTYGRYVYAIGGNTQAARLGGVRVNAIRVSTFALSGTAAALAGTLDASRVLSAQASSGQFLTFTVLTGIIVGGTSILGGEGTIGRTVLGCLFVALIANGFNLLGLDPFYQQVTLGVILLLAVGVDAWSRRFE